MSNDPVLSAASRVQRVRHELKRRTLQVVRVQALSPGLCRVTFGGDELADFVSTVFRQKIRFIGAGTIGVAAIWTLLRVIGPIIRGITGALAANTARKGAGYESLALTGTLPSDFLRGQTPILRFPTWAG